VFIVAWKAAFTFGGYAPHGQLMTDVLYTSAWVNVLLAVFNLVPIPPLDGSRVMAWLLPASMRPSYISLERFGMLLVLGVVFLVPGFQKMLGEGMETMMKVIFTLTGGMW